MSIKSLLSILLLAAFVRVQTASAEDSLDGKSYVVAVTKAGEESSTNENIEFTDGKFESTFMEDKGFDKPKYRTSQEGETTYFSATATNKDGDKLYWNGTESGGVLKGTVVAKKTSTTWKFESGGK